ncbi:MAG: isoaspartyl peptidase/L-asparaginase [Planctomycetota bacterium]|nr:isoaspartyl peptidase/L-asparaginase [Planctomycetota bacterium]
MTPLIISTWSFSLGGSIKAWPALVAGGGALDACICVCDEAEDDPRINSVGYGGLPDATGRVSLDGAVMESPSACGSICGLRRHRHPVRAARSVMRATPHVMLVGQDADDFADAHGHQPSELLSPEAAARWDAWRRDPRSVDQSRDQAASAGRPRDLGVGKGEIFVPPPEFAIETPAESRWRAHDTVGVLSRDSLGRLAGACSTSGTPFKVPGRVGDSPIIGHGLYVDPSAGAATATGTGELIMGVCGSYLAVEQMRRGATPVDALAEVLRRIESSYDLEPHHQAAMICMNARGEWAAAALRSGFLAVVHDEQGGRTVEPSFVLRTD